jgi:hypothetical protein
MSDSKPTADNEGLSDPPNLGSKEAQNMGCLCPVLDNAHGKGYMGMKDVFVYRQDCPLHCENSLDQPREK